MGNNQKTTDNPSPCRTRRRSRWSAIHKLTALWAIVLSPAVLDARTWRSSLYPADWKPPVGLSFAGDKMIQDFSYAGYRRGEVGIPTPDPKRRIGRVGSNRSRSSSTAVAGPGTV